MSTVHHVHTWRKSITQLKKAMEHRPTLQQGRAWETCSVRGAGHKGHGWCDATCMGCAEQQIHRDRKHMSGGQGWVGAGHGG